MTLLLTTDAVGGVWRYSLTLAQEWIGAGQPVTLAVLGPALDPAQRAEAASVPALVVIETGLPLDWTAADAASLEAVAAAIARLAAAIDARSIHLHAPALVGHAVAWPVPVVAVMHSCLLTWWQTMRGGPVPTDFRWRIEATAAGLHRADRIVAPSHAFAAAIRRAYGSMTRLTVILNGRHPHPAPAMSAQRPRAVLSTGRFWDEGKDAATLDAMAALLDAPVLAAGGFRAPDGRETPSTNLTRLGHLDEPGLANAFASARVFVSTARYEPFGLGVLEAAQAGLALVLADIPSFRELWDGAASFAPPGDASAFAACAARVLAQPSALGEAAQERSRRYPAGRMAAATLALHREPAETGLIQEIA